MRLYLYNEDLGYDDAKTTMQHLIDPGLASIDTMINMLLSTPTVGVQQSNIVFVIFRASGYFNCMAFVSIAPKSFTCFNFTHR